ncbi:MAG: sigma-54 interaction domain-containing protein [Ignavibacteriales bacterium]
MGTYVPRKPRDRRLRIGLVGGGEEVLPLLESLGSSELVEVAGVYAPPGAQKGPAAGASSDLRRFLEEVRPDVVVVVDQSLLPRVVQEKGGDAEIISGRSLEALMVVVEDKNKLDTILNAVQEGVQLADRDGIIRYVNPAFTAITGVPPSGRIGRSAFEVSPDGALVKALRTGKKVFGLRNRAVGSKAEVLSNASPIFVNGEMVGAVVVFQDITKMNQLMRELNERNQLIQRLTDRLEQFQSSEFTFQDIIGESPAAKNVINIAMKVAASDTTVLIQGESGTGKELFAHAIHNASPRRNGPFIKVNCAAIPENLMESELMGYEKGAYTGASKTKLGKFELADGGTILLDEVAELGITVQAKLLRLLQFREFERLGGTKPVNVDVRIIAATNRDLKTDVAAGRFREDLFYRLNVVALNLPPLRERLGDIPLFVERFISQLNERLGKHVLGVSPEAMDLITRYPWPGNVRELANVLERAMLLGDEEVISPSSLQACLPPGNRERGSGVGATGSKLNLRDLERDALALALQQYGGSTEGKRLAARALGISLATLYNKMRRYDMFRTENTSG